MIQEKKEGKGLLARIWHRICYALGFYKSTPYIEERLRDSDVSCLYFQSLVVCGIEIWMLIRYTVKYGSMCETVGEFFHYTYGYWVLLLTALILFIYSWLYQRGKMKPIRKYSQLFCLAFYVIAVYFGAKTSISDFSRGRMITCFLTMIMFGTVLVIKRPFISILLTLGSAYIFIYILNHYSYNKEGVQLTLSSGDMINYITFIIILIILEVSVYFQRFHEACKAYEMEQVAITDSLTGIHNMYKFEMDAKQYMETSLKEEKYPLFLLFDIQHFQTFNDHFDFAGGNELLIQLGQLLVEAFPGEPVARHTIDDFAVLTNAPDYMDRIAQIREKIKASYPTETYLDIKVGGYRAKDAQEDVRRCVDHASYAQKQIYNNEKLLFREYDEQMSKDYSLRQYILNNVEKAVSEGYIQVYYQPVVWSKNKKLAGSEALVRWIDPTMGFMSPGVFIPTLEEGRLIHKLDQCVYELVCKRIRDCLDQGLPIFPVSLNFSRLDFELMDVVDVLEGLVQKYNIPKDYLHVEVTESAVSKDVAGLKHAMDRLHQLGYSIWLDDFGSGYSSMNVLKDFDFDVLKIDMEFLRNFHGNQKSRTIISTVIDLANGLHMRTLCEGVETEEAINFLTEAGCERLQGFYYSKPVPYEELLALIQEGKLEIESI